MTAKKSRVHLGMRDLPEWAERDDCVPCCSTYA